MIGNAHIDAVWLWPWQEGYQEVRATFTAALDRIAEYPDFVFTCDSVAYLAWIEEHAPDLFDRLREQVRAGRFEIVGGWWVEPDCNIPSGESFARHALYSQRYLVDRFGRPASIGCNVDPFGQNANIPQFLARAGMDSYVFMRPQPQEKELPGGRRSGGSRRTARGCLPTASRTSTPAPAGTSPCTSARRWPSCRTPPRR